MSSIIFMVLGAAVWLVGIVWAGKCFSVPLWGVICFIVGSFATMLWRTLREIL